MKLNFDPITAENVNQLHMTLYSVRERKEHDQPVQNLTPREIKFLQFSSIFVLLIDIMQYLINF